MKNLICFPAFHSGTSLSQMRDSLKYLIDKYDYAIEIKDKFEIKDGSSAEYFDSMDEVKIYPKIITDLIDEMPSKLLLMDFFFPGIDTLLYAKEIAGKSIKIGSLMHGGSFLPGDLYRWDWLENDEKFWFEINQEIYVGSNFFKKQIPEGYRNKVISNYWGMDGIKFPVLKEKKYDVIFPHRMSSDKGVEDLIKIVSSIPEAKFAITSYDMQDSNENYKILKQFNNIEFIFGENEEEHLLTLASSKIALSCATQETYGYSMAKAVMCGCIPIVPNREVYPEIYPKNFIYNDIDDSIKKIRNFIGLENSDDSIIVQLRKDFEMHSFKPLLEKFFEL